ncbi:hypothetical protein L1987_36626 [Smallanthus sonchifolius]|uniref:Uncharacterized protein n=1 Tax=Smallanthus sonchifolius TaxID=185202 RepID=A0ACB9HES4_9ASTR|nr:hypothetical protein L1987_36626 [Smallanthus sonchifolius]
MVRMLSFLNVLTTLTLMFMFFQTGSCRELIMRSSKGVDHFATSFVSRRFQESREVMELDYEDAGPNINERSGFTQPLPSQEPPASRH